MSRNGRRQAGEIVINRGDIKQPTPSALKKLYWRSKTHYKHIKDMAELISPVRRFLRDQVTLRRAEDEIRKRLDRRAERLIDLVRERVYERGSNSYLLLLKNAGCEFADFRAEVQRHGVERTLERLAAEGVYLTSEEFKGKQEVVRGNCRFWASPNDFGPLEPYRGYMTQSSGTRNAPVPSLVSMDWLAARTYVSSVFFFAHDLFSSAHAMYDGVLPGAGGVNNLLIYARTGVVPDRWFARRVPGFSYGYHLATTYLILLVGRLFGPGFPKPEFIEAEQVGRIVEWALARRREGRTCCITTAASNATRVARAAWEKGVSLSGTKFICVGEPFTDAKRQIIERAGATGTTRYAYGGSVNIGFGCGNPVHTDEIHVNQYLLALISHQRSFEEKSQGLQPLLCTSLESSAPRFLLNVESGDYANFHKRDCGCPLEKVGLTLHMHRIRSFEKFTSEGVNYNFTDLYRILEDTLPSQFGGIPGDYQLVEEEDGIGQSRISLFVHPRVGELREGEVLEQLRVALGERHWHSRYWKAAGTLRIRREVPYESPRGKILPLHILH